MSTYKVYSSDGFQLLGTFPRRTAALAAIAEQRYGFFTLESPDGRVESVPAYEERGGRNTFTENARERPVYDRARARKMQALFSQKTNEQPVYHTYNPKYPSRQYEKPFRRPPHPNDDGRRGTGHKHPPGPRRCPKCGV